MTHEEKRFHGINWASFEMKATVFFISVWKSNWESDALHVAKSSNSSTQRKLVGWVIIMFSAKVSLFISMPRSFLRYFLCFEQMVDAPECMAHEEIIWFWRNLMKLDSGRSINARDVIYIVSMERFTQHFSNNRANRTTTRVLFLHRENSQCLHFAAAP